MESGRAPAREPGSRRAWWLLAVAIVAAVLVAVITKIGGAPTWVQLTCLAVGTTLGLVVVELRARRPQHDKTAAVVRENVRDASQTLPRMRDVGVEDAGVHRATEDVDYVRRDVESEVERRLRAERRVLIVGPSMSGKTRMALEVTYNKTIRSAIRRSLSSTISWSRPDRPSLRGTRGPTNGLRVFGQASRRVTCDRSPHSSPSSRIKFSTPPQ